MLRFHIICQQGWLETLSCICVGSLLKNIRCDHEIIVGIPPRFGKISPATLRFLTNTDATVVEVDNDLEPEYPIGNKVFLFAQTSRDGLKVLLDSDAVLIKPFSGEMLPSSPAAVHQDAFCPAYGHPSKVWDAVFSGLGKVHCGQFYSAAFVVSPGSHVFPDVWLDHLRSIYGFADVLPQHKTRQYDQFSLAAAASEVDFYPLPNWDERNLLVNTPDRFYSFDSTGRTIHSEHPYFYILQKNFLYRQNRQGTPAKLINTPNTLYYYNDIRFLIDSIVREYPVITKTPGWQEYRRKVMGPAKRFMT